MTDAVAAAVGAFLLAVASGTVALATPRVVAGLPEPDPGDSEAGSGPPKEAWVELAALPCLGPKVALAAALVGALVGWRLGPAWPLLTWAVVVPVGVALAVLDWRTRLLPTRLIWPAYGVTLVAVGLGALAAGDWRHLVWPVVGSAGGFLVFYLLWFASPRSLGFGDVRLSALLGLALAQLGPGELVLGLYAGFLLGGVGGLVMRLTGALARRQHLPFGPFMVGGAVVGVLWGGPLAASIPG